VWSEPEGPCYSPEGEAVTLSRSHYKFCNAYDATKILNWLQLPRHKRRQNSVLTSILVTHGITERSRTIFRTQELNSDVFWSTLITDLNNTKIHTEMNEEHHSVRSRDEKLAN